MNRKNQLFLFLLMLSLFLVQAMAVKAQDQTNTNTEIMGKKNLGSRCKPTRGLQEAHRLCPFSEV